MLDNLSPLRIQETYTLLENIHTPDGLYHPKYQYASLTKTNLSLKNTKQFLADIKNQLESTSKNLTALLNKETIKALFNLEGNDALNILIVHLLKEQEQRITPDLLCTQLAEFIDLSRLTHFVAKTPKGFIDAAQYPVVLAHNKSLLEEFATLTQLKFKLFEVNLIHLLETSQKQSPILEEIVSTLITSYLPKVAVARYPIGISLSKYDTSADKLKTIIENKKIPALRNAFDKYKDNTEVYYDANEPEEDFYDAEDLPDVNPKILPSSSYTDIVAQDLAQPSRGITPVCTEETMPTAKNESNVAASNENKHKKCSLTHFWNWVKNLLNNILKSKKHSATTFHSTMNMASHSQASTPCALPSHSQPHTKTKRTSSHGASGRTWKNKDAKATNLSSSKCSFFPSSPSSQSSLQNVTKHYMKYYRRLI